MSIDTDRLIAHLKAHNLESDETAKKTVKRGLRISIEEAIRAERGTRRRLIEAVFNQNDNIDTYLQKTTYFDLKTQHAYTGGDSGRKLQLYKLSGIDPKSPDTSLGLKSKELIAHLQEYNLNPNENTSNTVFHSQKTILAQRQRREQLLTDVLNDPQEAKIFTQLRIAAKIELYTLRQYRINSGLDHIKPYTMEAMQAGIFSLDPTEDELNEKPLIVAPSQPIPTTSKETDKAIILKNKLEDLVGKMGNLVYAKDYCTPQICKEFVKHFADFDPNVLPSENNKKSTLNNMKKFVKDILEVYEGFESKDRTPEMSKNLGLSIKLLIDNKTMDISEVKGKFALEAYHSAQPEQSSWHRFNPFK